MCVGWFIVLILMSRIIKNNYVHRSRNVTYVVHIFFFNIWKRSPPLQFFGSYSTYHAFGRWSYRYYVIFMLMVFIRYMTLYKLIQCVAFHAHRECESRMWIPLQTHSYAMLLVRRICKALIASFWIACVHILCCTKIKRFCCRSASVPTYTPWHSLATIHGTWMPIR